MSVKPGDRFIQVVEDEGRVTMRFAPNTALTEANAEELSRELAALGAREGQPHLVVDLGGVTMLTSVILAKFLALNGRVRAAGGRLTLMNPNPIVQQVLKVTRLDQVLEVTALPA